MGRPVRRRAAEPADAGRRARGTGRRLTLGVAVVVGAVALALVPGWDSNEASTPLDRLLDSATTAEDQRPTLQTVQSLAAQLSDSSGDQPIDPERLASVSTSPGPYQVLGELAIPAISLDVELGNGVDPDTLARGPGHWTGTPMPGQLGNAVVSGHRTTHTAPFQELDELAEGDEITVSTQTGTSTTYLVTEVLVVPVEVYTTEVLAQPGDTSVRELTLFACHPEGSLTHRIVVHAQAAP